jgi:hypothetical protein
VTYGTGIGSAMRDIAMMLQAGFETRVFYTGFGGFDTHAAQGSLTGSARQPARRTSTKRCCRSPTTARRWASGRTASSR